MRRSASIGLRHRRARQGACRRAGAHPRLHGAADFGGGDFFVLTRARSSPARSAIPARTGPTIWCWLCWSATAASSTRRSRSRWSGELEIGAKLDPHTGAVRLVRLRDARWQPIDNPRPE